MSSFRAPFWLMTVGRSRSPITSESRRFPPLNSFTRLSRFSRNDGTASVALAATKASAIEGLRNRAYTVVKPVFDVPKSTR